MRDIMNPVPVVIKKLLSAKGYISVKNLLYLISSLRKMIRTEMTNPDSGLISFSQTPPEPGVTVLWMPEVDPDNDFQIIPPANKTNKNRRKGK